MTGLLQHKALRLSVLSVLVLLALFLLAQTWDTMFGKDSHDHMNVITVEGTGEVTSAPDMAQITFTVTESAADVATAQAAATKKNDEALSVLKELSISDKDIKTLGYNVSPKYSYDQPCGPGMYCPQRAGTPTIVGYDVSQTIEVKVRDTEKVGKVLQGLGEKEVQNISGPNFMIDDEDGVQNEARAKAIEQARAKAKQLAKELGVRLGDVVAYSENGDYPQPMMFGAKGGVMMEASAPTLPVGENLTSVTVSVTYEIR
jgi:uncharacterized protein